MLAHAPIILIPASVGADVAGRIADSGELRKIGRLTMPLATLTGAVAGATGLVAEQEVVANDRGRRLLDSHRNLNLLATAVTTAMSAYRSAVDRPGWAYLSAGIAASGLIAYSSYLGGQMVYVHGVGVQKAGGLDHNKAPAIRPGNTARVVKTFGRQLLQGIKDAVGGLFGRPKVDTDYGPDAEEFGRAMAADNEEPGAIPVARRRL